MSNGSDSIRVGDTVTLCNSNMGTPWSAVVVQP